MEHWKEFKKGWLVSDKGNIKTTAVEKIFYIKGKKQSKIIPAQKYGIKDYSDMCFCIKSNDEQQVCKVAELVATAFVSNPNHFTHLHYIDGDKQNIQAENLKWIKKEYSQEKGENSWV